MKSPGAARALLFAGCVSACEHPDCKTEIPEGATYRVQVLEETADSNACHAVPLPISSELDVVAGPGYSVSPDECTTRAASNPPPVENVEVTGCRGTPGRGYFGIVCLFQHVDFPCEGSVEFYLEEITEPELLSYDVHDAIYEVAAAPSANCPPSTTPPAGCVDRYRVSVRRIRL